MNSPYINYDKVLSRPKSEYTPDELETIKEALRKDGKRLEMNRTQEAIRKAKGE